MSILVTGACGFIGFHLSGALLAEGYSVVGLDRLDSYYSPALKNARLARLKEDRNFTSLVADIADHAGLERALDGHEITKIVHLAGQPGVRHSLKAPRDYIESNIVGFLNVLEHARRCSSLETMIYASSSSVYGDRDHGVFKETDRCDAPVSLYSATKLSDELIAHSYAHLFAMPLTGVRLFTVYGSWGRPDMAYWTFAGKIMRGEPIELFNNGNVARDYTHISDVVRCFLSMLKAPENAVARSINPIYNIGIGQPRLVCDLVAALESALGKKALVEKAPMQKGDVHLTHAGIEKVKEDYGFSPIVSLEEGIGEFIAWYRKWHAND